MGTRRSPTTRLIALIEAAERLGHRNHVGVTATAPGFFGAQGRPIPQLPIRYPDLAEDMARQRVMNFEMEASALLVLATLARCRAGVVWRSMPTTKGDFVEANSRRAEALCRTGWKPPRPRRMDARQREARGPLAAALWRNTVYQAPLAAAGLVPATRQQRSRKDPMAQA